jgi:hypothetical protein
MAEQKANEGALGRLVDGHGDDADLAVLKAADDLEQLAYAILHEHGELADRWVVSPAHRRKAGSCPFTNAHGKIALC